MLKRNCVKGVKVKILAKSYGNPIRCIGSAREGTINYPREGYVNVRVIGIEHDINPGGYYNCNFNYRDLQLLGSELHVKS